MAEKIHRTADFHEAAVLWALGASVERVDRRARGVAVVDCDHLTAAEVERSISRTMDAFRDTITAEGDVDVERLILAIDNSFLGDLGAKYLKLKNRVL